MCRLRSSVFGLLLAVAFCWWFSVWFPPGISNILENIWMLFAKKPMYSNNVPDCADFNAMRVLLQLLALVAAVGDGCVCICVCVCMWHSSPFVFPFMCSAKKVASKWESMKIIFYVLIPQRQFIFVINNTDSFILLFPFGLFYFISFFFFSFLFVFTRLFANFRFSHAFDEFFLSLVLHTFFLPQTFKPKMTPLNIWWSAKSMPKNKIK